MDELPTSPFTRPKTRHDQQPSDVQQEPQRHEKDDSVKRRLFVEGVRRVRLRQRVGRRFLDMVRERLQMQLDVAAETDIVGVDHKKERISNFFAVPVEIERLMLFGVLACFDAFLSVLVVLPLNLLRTALNITRTRRLTISPAEHCQLLKAALVVLCCLLMQYLDASQLYHSIRGQSVVKLYVIFNVLEIGDRLCCSFGQDILDSLFAKTFLSDAKGSRINSAVHFAIAAIYVFIHTLILYYQVITLNVAINSHNNALLTLLVSNQFVEIKGSVFKKFEKENLFQVSCSDIVERFQLAVFLTIISVRNLLELRVEMFSSYAREFDTATEGGIANVWLYLFSILTPSFWTIGNVHAMIESIYRFIGVSLPSTIYAILMQPFSFTMDINSFYSLFDALFYPVLLIWGSEVTVDWLKHAFITKFNQIRPTAYNRFMDILCKDVIHGRPGMQHHSYADELNGVHTLYVARRIGFASLPLVCLFLRSSIQILHMMGVYEWHPASLIISQILLLTIGIGLKLSCAELVHFIAINRISRLTKITKVESSPTPTTTSPVRQPEPIHGSAPATPTGLRSRASCSKISESNKASSPPNGRPPVFVSSRLGHVHSNSEIVRLSRGSSDILIEGIYGASSPSSNEEHKALEVVQGESKLEISIVTGGVSLGDSKSEPALSARIISPENENGDDVKTSKPPETHENNQVDNDEEDKILWKNDEELLADVKMEHPYGRLSLENLDRYTLYKSRIP